MVMIKLTQTDDYAGLTKLFIENELEVSDEEPVPTDVVKAWKIVDENAAGDANPPKLIGGIILSKREGEFIIDGIAVDPGYRKQRLGESLLGKAVEEIRRVSGDRLYLVARAPGFFRTQGFETVAKENAPYFFECLTCPQYGASCHPEVMKLEIGD